ncbi:MAG: hypothetical protein B1H11_09335 [Desulfobacteraceae bacterium 4484_190.1]|nr:MAG: hypothetical protein B1H11_09335 [Desulfobacteraceae bacterium 4484_190.1]
MIRSFCLNTFIAFNTIIFCGWTVVVVFILRKRGKETFRFIERPWARFIIWVCGIKGRITGKDNVQKDTAYIFMSNHQSFFDIFILTAHIPVPFKFVLKNELMKLFPLGPAMKLVGHAAIDRKNPKKAIKSLEAIAKKIKEGTSFLIFPEGTRSNDGHLNTFKKGGFRLAIKSGCDIVPVIIKGSHDIVPKGSLKIMKSDFELQIGHPIQVKGYGKQDIYELMDKTRNIMLEMLEG